MAVKEALLPKTHDEESSVLKFFSNGATVWAKVVKALNKQMAKADTEKRSTGGVALLWG